MGIQMAMARSLDDHILRCDVYYHQKLIRMIYLAKKYPQEYKLQIGPDIIEYAEESWKMDKEEDPISQELRDRFEIMELGFGVECYQGTLNDCIREARRNNKCVMLPPNVRDYYMKKNNISFP